VHVDLDLAADVFGFDPEVDVDFDLRFSCSNGTIAVTTLNRRVNVDSAWYAELLSLGLINILDNTVANSVGKGFQPISLSVDSGTSFCPRISVEDDADVVFSLF
jgi:hypothetical protein